MSSKTALFIQHQPIASPGMLGEAFADEGYEIDVLPIDETSADVRFPDPRDYDVVIPLGASRSVYEPDLVRTWVGAEMAMLRDADAAGVPVLGVCFGGQLLAQAHGGAVERSDRPEIGWYTVHSDRPDSVPEGPWFQWHFDRWVSPPGAVEIARNDNAPQAFVLRRSLAVQFHPELDGDLLEVWLASDPAPSIDGVPLDVASMRQRTRDEQESAARRVRSLVGGFLSVC
jgi:GMP synthase-like glutamine amidotransferase